MRQLYEFSFQWGAFSCAHKPWYLPFKLIYPTFVKVFKARALCRQILEEKGFQRKKNFIKIFIHSQSIEVFPKLSPYNILYYFLHSNSQTQMKAIKFDIIFS